MGSKSLHRGIIILAPVLSLALAAKVLAAPMPGQPTAAAAPGRIDETVGSPRSLELNEEGIAALKARRLDKAEELFRKALAVDPKNATAAFNLAGALMANQKEKEAAALLSEYVKDYPNDPGMYVRLGDAWFANKNIQDASKAYLKAREMFPNYPGLAAKLGTVYGLQNNLEKAEQMFLEAVEQDPKNPQLLSNLATIFLGNGNFDKAVSTAKRALAVKASSEVYVTLGTAYEMQQDYQNALIALQRAADLGDSRRELKDKIAELKARTGTK